MTDTGYYEIFQLERQRDRARVLKRATKVKERGPTRRPDMTRDVIRPTFWAFVLGWGFIFSFSLVLMGWYASYDNPQVWFIAIGFTLMAGSWFGIVVMRDQLQHYRNLQIVTREFELEVADTGRARIMTRDPDNPRRSTITRYQWAPGKLRDFAASNVNQYGEWRGPDRLIRKHLAGYVTGVNEKYRDVTADFEALGWIDADQRWTAKGKAEMARKAVE